MSRGREREDGDGGRPRSRRGLLTAAAAGGLGVIAGETIGGIPPALANNGQAVLQGTNNGTATARTAVLTANEIGALADPNTGGKGSLGVYGHGQDFGVYADVASNGNGTGVKGVGSGAGDGVRGVGGPVSGNGVTGTGGGGRGAGVLGTGGPSNGAGVVGFGVGTGGGMVGLGGARNGPGVLGTGGASNGPGVHGFGTGTGAGVAGTGGASGIGVAGTGGASGGTGVVGTGTDVFAGVFGIGGASNGVGVSGLGGGGSGIGVAGAGTGTGDGVLGKASTGNGAHGTATAAGGVGVLAENTAGGIALKATGPAVFSRSGLLTVAAGKSSGMVTGVALTSASLVLATLQQDRAGVWVRSAVPNIAASSFTVHLSKAVTASITVAWFVVN